MKIKNDFSNSGKKLFKTKTSFTKLNAKNSIKIIDDPAFHLNRTLKQYINYKLNQKISRINNNNGKDSGDNKLLNNLSSEDPKLKDKSNSLNRANTVSNIFKNRNLFLNKKSNKLKKTNFSLRSKSNSGKKMIKSMSSNKINLNLNHPEVIIKNKNKNVKKINKYKILEKNNSRQKYFRHSGSTALSINHINQLQEKNNGISPYKNYNSIYNNNALLSNHSTLEFKNLKAPMNQTTDKKNKFTKKYYTHNNYYKCSNIKNKDKKISNICLVKKMKSINCKKSKNNKYLDGSDNKKAVNNKQIIDNSNIIIGNNNTNNQTDIKKDNNILKQCYTISNIKNTPQKYNKNAIDNNTKKNDILCSFNINENKINTDYIKNDNSLEYIKRIELLENENRLLKGEINESKNKLLLLENKINKLLIEKNSIEKEECPRPTPYVKKYSMDTLQNLPYNDININNSKVKIKPNESKIINNLNDKAINENNTKKMMKNHFWNKIQKYSYQPSNNNKQKKKLSKLKKNKSSHYLKSIINTQNKSNINNNFQNILYNNNENKNLWKKVNNMQQLVEKFKITHSNFFTEGNIKCI